MTQRFGAFSNPIISGSGTLIREAIRSPNYVPGVSGWTINRDGTASFNSTTINGDLKVTGTNGSVVWIREVGPSATIEVYPPTADPDLVPARIRGTEVSPGNPILEIVGPGVTPSVNFPYMLLRSEPGTDTAYIDVIAKQLTFGVPSKVDPTFSGSAIRITSQYILDDCDFTFTRGEFRSTLDVYNFTGAWIGFNNGQMVERDGAGNAITSVRWVDNNPATFSSVSFIANPASPLEGMTFRAPSTGNVKVEWAAGLGNSTASGATLVGWELRTGSTIGSGTVILGSSDDRAIENNGGNRQYGSFFDVTGLVPGDQYNFRFMYRNSAASTGVAIRRRFTITPILY